MFNLPTFPEEETSTLNHLLYSLLNYNMICYWRKKEIEKYSHTHPSALPMVNTTIHVIYVIFSKLLISLIINILCKYTLEISSINTGYNHR